MSKKMWDWRYLKPVDHLDILRSENIDKGRMMHEAIHKRMKELIGSGPPLKFVGPTLFPTAYYHYANVDNVFQMIPDNKKNAIEVKILKNRSSQSPIYSWTVDKNAAFKEEQVKELTIIHNDDYYSFEVLRSDLEPDSIPDNTNNKSQISICSSCNYQNEYIPFDPDYKCYKCKKGL